MPARVAALAVSLLLAGDPHLPVIPRNAAEAARVAAITAPPTGFAEAERFEAQSAGAATVRARRTADAFSQSSANMAFDRQMDFKLGNGLFRKLWVAAPASTLASDGLGPLTNARACQNCHIKDGRGHPPGPDDAGVSMVLRLVAPGGGPDPRYGAQLQDHAVPGQAAEGRVVVQYAETTVTLRDGATVALRTPSYAIAEPGYGPFAPGLALSPRVAPQMIGLGLLEAIPAAEIVARADPDDADGDGISGRARTVWSAEHGAPMLGRFGLKAEAATVRAQSAAAFATDMGLSSPLHPDPWGDCTPAQPACRAARHGQAPGIRDGLEVDGQSLDLVTFYARNLGVPQRRGVADPTVLRGKAVFHAAGCAACHTPKHVTHRLAGQPEQSFQLIWPYTDLLLHDMGAGLADMPGDEWRTPPLWGIGLTEAVSGHTLFLHDGRARNLVEAILWHGGEGQGARDAFAQAPAADRAALIAFLESL